MNDNCYPQWNPHAFLTIVNRLVGHFVSGSLQHPQELASFILGLILVIKYDNQGLLAVHLSLRYRYYV